MVARRHLLAGFGGAIAASCVGFDDAFAQEAITSTLPLSRPFSPGAGPRSRLLLVNDLSGDIDGLFATVHQVLTPTAELRGIVGTTTGTPGETAVRSAELAREMLQLMGMPGRTKVYDGAAGKMTRAGAPVRSSGTQAIIDEAMRSDSKLPLYVAVGGGLTEVASALLIEPRIASRFTLVWIGGDALPGGGTGETNFNIDPLAAQHVFNDTQVPIWQLPRAVYQTCVVSASELQAYVAPHGAIGRWLYDRLADLTRKSKGRINTGETWTLGDSPLVLLTALHDWVPSEVRPTFNYQRTGSSVFDKVVGPRLNPDGTFSPRSEGREIRVYTSIDTRMLFSDFFAKMRVNFPS